MNVQCSICQDGLESSQDISITPCGHVFHYVCITRWLDKSLTCPQCRQKIVRDRMMKIYFTFANVEAVQEDSFTLQQKLDSISFKLKLREAEVANNTKEIATLKKQNVGLKEEIKKAERTINEKTSAIHGLKEQTAFFKNKCRDTDSLQEKYNRLCKTLETYDNIQTLITASGEEVDKLLGANRDVTTLTTYVAILKRELNANLEKRKELRGIIRNLQSEVQSYKMKRDSFSQEYLKRIEELEEEIVICRNERDSLQTQLLELRKNMSNEIDADENRDQESNLTLVNKVSRKRDADFKENSDAVPKKSKISTEIFKLSSSPSKDKSDIVLVEPISKKTKENLEASPYLPTKSKGIMSFRSRALSGNLSSNWIQPAGNSSSFKAGTSKMKVSREKDPAITFDGFGGHSKIDAFPLPKSSPNKLKRPASDLAKSKKLKVDSEQKYSTPCGK